MYQTIHVPVDNSEHSHRAVRLAIELGRRFGSKLTGSHIYAARMHDYRFKQMEFTLPEEYRQESELEKQRRIHDSLITMGLKLVSDCYLEDMAKRCAEAGLPLERKMMDGKHHVEILKDIRASRYDLTILGALGIGRSKDSQLGAVAAEVARHSPTDVWVVRHLGSADEVEADTILVGIDGSPQAFGGLMTAIELAKRFDKRIELIGVYDPYLHYQVFNGIVEVLTDKAAQVFRFEEQNQLHEEVIDTGLAQIYQSHLNVGANLIDRAGLKATQTLLDGKCFQKILDHARKSRPWLLVLGRIGVHSDQGAQLMGSNTEQLLRLAPCDLLISSRLEVPELDLRAEESITWTREAEERMTRVPPLVKGIARTAVLRLAVEQGHSVITNSVIDAAMERFMPKQVAERTEKLGEALAFEQARRGGVALCRRCGVTASVESPVTCAVCGGTEFETVSSAMVDQIIAHEGGAQTQAGYDGRNLQWTREAARTLNLVSDLYQRRRAKARIEKTARLKKLTAVDQDLVQRVLREEMADLPLDPSTKAQLADTPARAADPAGKAFSSVYPWSDEALERILRVPAGFMRDKVQQRVEALAQDRQLLRVELELVEEGVALGRQMMAEMLEGYQKTGTYNLNEVGIMSKLDQRRSEIQATPSA